MDIKGIIYCATRKTVDAVAAALRPLTSARIDAYHAGMTDMQREMTQNRFVNNQVDVIVATNAFGKNF